MGTEKSDLNDMFNRVVDRLKVSEGFRSKPYRDSRGILTIGYGTNIQIGLSPEEAELLLKFRLTKSQTDLVRNLPWWLDLDDVRKSVLLDMCYNMGIGTLLTFRNTLRLVKEGHYDLAATHMLKSAWARQVKDRAVVLSNAMRNGVWPEEN